MTTASNRGCQPGAAAVAMHRGSNQSDMRAFNERLVLTMIRHHGALSKIGIARLTGLSAQTTSVIMRSLERQGLLRREAPVRGRVGQPAVPLSIDPDGAYFLGLNVGRRNGELVAIDFTGQVRELLHIEYRYPTPGQVVSFARRAIRAASESLGQRAAARIAGLGIAMPFQIWSWADRMGATQAALDAWRETDLVALIGKHVRFPVHLVNDATAACGAELVFGERQGRRNILYFYIGAFVGGGVVLDGSLVTGPSGNAGALGSLLVPGRKGVATQLLQLASLSLLEDSLAGSGLSTSSFWSSPDSWEARQPQIQPWMRTAADALAHAIVSACSVFEFETAIIDGWMPESVRAHLVKETRSSLAKLESSGLTLPDVQTGSIGVHASAIGAAGLALTRAFMVDRNTPSASVLREVGVHAATGGSPASSGIDSARRAGSRPPS